MEENHRKVTEYLNKLKGNEEESETLIRTMCHYLKEGDLTLKDIGTTEAEIEKLKVAGSRIKLRKLLISLGKNPGDYEINLALLRSQLEADGLTLKDIGTTEGLIEKLRVNSCLAEAIECLIFMDLYEDKYDYWFHELRDAMEAGSLTAEDIGTTEVKIKALRKKGCNK